jgi:hypothetical protein
MSPSREALKKWIPAPLRPAAKSLKDVIEQGVGALSAHRRPGNVAMFHVGRSGSTVLARLLDQHPRVWWDGETYYNRWEQLGGSPDLFGSFDPARHLRRRMRAAGDRYYGFEVKFLPEQQLKIIQMELADFVDSICDLGISHFISLKRKNYVRRTLSQLIGRKTQVRHIDRGARSTLTRVRIDVDCVEIGVTGSAKPLLERFHELDAAHGELDRLLANKRALHLTYEDDILDDPQRAVERVCAFLNIEPHEGRVSHGRTNPFRIDEMVENFDELARVLSGTKFEWMLND